MTLSRVCNVRAYIAIIALLISGLISSPTYAGDWSITQQKHVYGGDRNFDTFYSGIDRVNSAYSGEINAVVFHEHSPSGTMLVFVDENGELAIDPIRLIDDYHSADVIWDGENFVVFVAENTKLSLYKYSANGELNESKEYSDIHAANYPFISAEYLNGYYHVIVQTSESSAKLASINKLGQIQSTKSLNYKIGSETDLVFLDNAIAMVRSYYDSSILKPTFLNVVDYEGNELVSQRLPDSSTTPFPSIAWNGENLLIVLGDRLEAGGVELAAYSYDLNGEEAYPPKRVGYIPPESYHFKVNFTTELIWIGDQFVLQYDYNAPMDATAEYLFIRSLDAQGVPLSDPVQVNAEPLEQINHSLVWTGESINAFSIEKGQHNASLYFTELQYVESGPYATPTFTPIPPTPTPTAIPTLPPETETVTIRAYIDGSDIINIQNDNVWYEHLDFAKPGLHDDNNFPTTINDVEWFPVWETDEIYSRFSELSEPFENLSPALPQEDGYYYQILSSNSRGSIAIAQTPSAENDYQLKVLLDDDSYGGADWYEFTIGWSPNAPEPLYEVPDGPYIVIDLLLSGTFPDAKLELNGENVNVLTSSRNDAYIRHIDLNGAIPNSPVNLALTMIKGDGEVAVTQQPRAINNFTGIIGIDPTSGNGYAHEYVLLITWKNVEEDPTPTPWPTIDPLQPTPTPLAPDASANVLWVIHSSLLETSGDHFGFDEFMNIFADLGADNQTCVVGSEPITDSLLSGNQAVIFSDPRNQPEITQEESSAIVRYVKNGGSIFVIGHLNGDAIVDLASRFSSSITKPFGIEFSTRAIGSSVFLISHPLLTNISELDSGNKLILQEPAFPIAAVIDRITNDQEVVLAAAEVGFGRVVAYSDEYHFYNYEITDNPFDGVRKRQFASNIAHWLLRKESELPPLPTPTPTLLPAPSDGDALELLQSVIEVNQPWLNPQPASFSYGLQRTYDGSQSIVGSYSVNSGGNNARRVGSLLRTALHIIDAQPLNISVQFAGQAVKDGITSDVLEIVYTGSAREEIGFGGQGPTSYTHMTSAIQSSRVYINPETLTPVLIESINGLWSDLINSSNINSWSFTGEFVEIDGGLAPTEIVFDRPSSFKERQEFQIVDGVWLFKEGDGWWGEETGSNRTGLIQSFNLVNLNVNSSDLIDETNVLNWQVH